ncbi:hypothetical protein EYF80_049820 [Liparis tanakae]|uniref:Uncharacterized protein n=1 Tax=Liparis tanakae TaxID=230148 RepID=A0A4Z2FIA0_9TELE|nr:hypothetical protein EYF80_049820 [Liparis tanakae]
MEEEEEVWMESVTFLFPTVAVLRRVENSSPGSRSEASRRPERPSRTPTVPSVEARTTRVPPRPTTEPSSTQGLEYTFPGARKAQTGAPSARLRRRSRPSCDPHSTPWWSGVTRGDEKTGPSLKTKTSIFLGVDSLKTWTGAAHQLPLVAIATDVSVHRADDHPTGGGVGRGEERDVPAVRPQDGAGVLGAEQKRTSLENAPLPRRRGSKGVGVGVAHGVEAEETTAQRGGEQPSE